MVYVDARRKKERMPVYVKVSRGRNDSFMVNTGLTSDTKFEGRVFPESETSHSAKTNKLNILFAKIEDMAIRNEDMDMKELKNAIQAVVLKKTTNAKPFTEYCIEYAEKCPTSGTAGLYLQTARKVAAYDDKATFDTMTVQWLEGFEKYCKKTMSVNGMGILLRNIRTVFNEARKNSVTDKYPFYFYKIKKEETRKRNLSVDQIRELVKAECMTERITEYRDMWLLMFYLIGINSKDLFTAQKKQLRNGRLEYRRAKTKKLYSIKVEPEAMEIIDKYKGKKYLLNIMERFASYGDYMRRMNHQLKHIGMKWKNPNIYDKNSKPIEENLSTYYARHSWATIAAELDITFETISAALGHSIANPTTAIYINFNEKKVDEANRKVIDYING